MDVRKIFRPAAGQRGIDQQTLMAQALLKQSQQGPPQGWDRMPTVPQYGVGQALPQIVSALVGGLAQKNAIDKQGALDKEISGGNAALIEAMTRKNDPMLMKRDDNNMPIPGTEFTQANNVQTGRPDLSEKGQMMSILLQGQDPQAARQMLTQIGMTQMFAKPEAYSLGQGEKRFEGGRMVAENPLQEKPLDPVAQVNADLKAGRITPQQADERIKKLNYMSPGTTINMPEQKYPNSFMDALGKGDAATLEKYRAAAEGSAGMVKTLTELKKLNPTALSGGGAQARADVANWLSGWTGIQVTDPTVLADTQKYNAIVSKSIMDSLGGSLGAGVSNADVAFLEKTVPKLEYSEQARNDLINYMSQRAQENIGLYEQAREYGEKNNGLRGFSPYKAPGSGPLPDSGSASRIERTENGYIYRPR